MGRKARERRVASGAMINDDCEFGLSEVVKRGKNWTDRALYTFTYSRSTFFFFNGRLRSVGIARVAEPRL